ncbi:DUF6086 family protein [Strepomyces sp. STD 3.1]|nr:DUF6086 family protein [Streptomyces sp. STD 3.1]
MGDRTLWNPSNGASRLFMSQVTVYQADVGLPSGIGPMEADECQIDPVAFAAFVDALLAWHSQTGHAEQEARHRGPQIRCRPRACCLTAQRRLRPVNASVPEAAQA